MIIESVHVKNFRSILDETLNCEKLTALVGANGSGKSSFLYAIGLFYSTSPKLEKEDYYGEDVSKEIIIAITFNSFDKEKETFCNYIQGEKLKVERIFNYDNGKITAKSLTRDNLLISRGISEIASFDDNYFSGYADPNLSILFPVNP